MNTRALTLDAEAAAPPSQPLLPALDQGFHAVKVEELSPPLSILSGAPPAFRRRRTAFTASVCPWAFAPLLLWPQPGGNLVHGQHKAYTPTRWWDGSAPSSPLGTHTHVANESGLPLGSFLPTLQSGGFSAPRPHAGARRPTC